MPKYKTYVQNGCDHQAAIGNVICDIRRQFMLWPSTVSTCATDGCQNFAKGSFCAECLAKDLAEVTGMPDASDNFLSFTEAAHKSACLLIAALDRAEG